jgi:Uncharacterized protein conserved in bacteria
MCEKIAFPVMGDYSVPIIFLLRNILNVEIIKPSAITNKTVEIGNKYSPNFVCTPFKFTLGTLIECVEKGANILIQAGGGCRYGYYAELQEEILKELGYDVKLYNLVTKGVTDFHRINKIFKEIDPKYNKMKGLYYLFLTSKMIKYMDKLDFYIRENIGFEEKKGSFIKIKRKMLKDFSKCTNYFNMRKTYKRYKYKFKQIKINKKKNHLKVGIIGELYTVMEPFANYDLEIKLASFGVSVKRFTNINYLLFEKKNKIKKYLKHSKEYVKYKMGADAADNIVRAKYLCEKEYDGIIHIKSSFCTPEIGAMSILNKVCHDYNVPIIYFTFDTMTSSTGIDTRLEAFYDMIEMRKKK